jgi:RNA recognition motif-containing protein
MNISVSNLSRETVENDLLHAFESHGHVMTVRIIKDIKSGESKGFGFIEMPLKADAENAIVNLNGSEINGRKVRVKGARPQN